MNKIKTLTNQIFENKKLSKFLMYLGVASISYSLMKYFEVYLGLMAKCDGSSAEPKFKI